MLVTAVFGRTTRTAGGVIHYAEETLRPLGTTETLTVEGMTCEGCERNVEDALRDVPGVADASADRDAETATVDGEADVDDLVGAVEGAGTTPSPRSSLPVPRSSGRTATRSRRRGQFSRRHAFPQRQSASRAERPRRRVDTASTWTQ